MSNSDAYSSGNIKKSLLFFIPGKVISGLCGFALLLGLVHQLSAEEYGVYILLIAVLEIVQLVSSFGCLSMAFRYVPEFRSKGLNLLLRKFIIQSCVFRFITLISFCLLVLPFANEIGNFVGAPSLKNAFLIYLFVVIFEGSVRFSEVIFDSLLLQKYSQITSIFRNIVKVSVLFGYAFWGGVDLVAWLKVEALTSLVALLLSIFLLWRFCSLKLISNGLNTADLEYKRLFRYGLPSYFSQILWISQGAETAKFFIAKFGSVIQVASFGFAYALSSMLQRYLPAFLLINMIRPIFVSAGAKARSTDHLLYLASLVFKVNFFTLAPILGVSIFLGSEILEILSGGKFVGAGEFLVVLLVLTTVQTYKLVLGLLALSAEDSRSVFFATLFGFLGIGIGILCFLWFGAISICFGLVLSEACSSYVLWRSLGKHRLVLRVGWDQVLGISVAAVLGGGCAKIVFLSIGAHSFLNLMISCGLGALTFLLAAYFLPAFSAKERATLNRYFPVPVFVW